MDNEIKTLEQRKAERQKALRFQRNVRIAAILLAIVLSIVSLFQSCATRKAIDELAAQIAAKKAAEAQTETIASPSPSVPAASYSADSITLSFLGDLELASPYGTGIGNFETNYNTYGEGYFFQNIRSTLQSDDLTVGVLRTSFTTVNQASDAEITYRADPSYTGILKDSGIDAVAVSGEYVMDFGEEGYVDTLANLDNAGIARFGGDYITTLDVSGVTVGLTAVNAYNDDVSSRLQQNIGKLKEQGAALIVAEIYVGDYYDGDALALATADMGAHVVLLHGATTFDGIEEYNNSYICYNLGSFLSGGDTSTKDAIIFQLTYDLSSGTIGEEVEWNIVPVTCSSDPYAVTYCPTIATEADAERIMYLTYTNSSKYEGGITEPRY